MNFFSFFNDIRQYLKVRFIVFPKFWVICIPTNQIEFSFTKEDKRSLSFVAHALLLGLYCDVIKGKLEKNFLNKYEEYY